MSLDFLRRNLGLKVISLILAISLWAYVKYTSTPYASMTSEAKISVPVSVEDKPDNLVAIDVPERVSVTVKGAPERLSKLKPSHFRATINLSDKKAGLHNQPVVVIPPPEVKVIGINPYKISLQLDPLEKRLVPVKIETTGSVSSGFILGRMSAKPENLLLSGAKSIISRVKEVQAVCDIDGAETDLVQRVSVDVVDENGKILDGLKVEPPRVRATINVHNEVVNATVPISATITGAPAKGYEISRITITPPTATIQYSYSLQPQPRMVKSQEIAIDGANSSIAREIGIIAPRDSNLLNPKNAKVHIMITKKQAEKPSSH